MFDRTRKFLEERRVTREPYAEDGWVNGSRLAWEERTGKTVPLNSCSYLRVALLYQPGYKIRKVIAAFLFGGPRVFGFKVPVLISVVLTALMVYASVKYGDTTLVVVASLLLTAYTLFGIIYGLGVFEHVVRPEVKGYKGTPPSFMLKLTSTYPSAWKLGVLVFLAPVLMDALIILVCMSIYGTFKFLFAELRLHEKAWDAFNVHPRKLPWLRPSLSFAGVLIWAVIVSEWARGTMIMIAVTSVCGLILIFALDKLKALIDRIERKQEEKKTLHVKTKAKEREEREITYLHELFNFPAFREFLQDNTMYMYNRRCVQRSGIDFEGEGDEFLIDREVVTTFYYNFHGMFNVDYLFGEFISWLNPVDDEITESFELFAPPPPIKVPWRRRAWRKIKNFFRKLLEVISAIYQLAMSLKFATVCWTIEVRPAKVDDADADSQDGTTPDHDTASNDTKDA